MAETKAVLIALGRKLAQFEAAGNDEKVKATKKRIAELEGAEEAKSDLADMTVRELRELAADAEIEGRTTMSKDELVEALSEEN